MSLSMLMSSNLSLVNAGTSWSNWVEYILDQKKYGVRHVSMLYQKGGHTAAASKNFHITESQMQIYMSYLDNPTCVREKIFLDGKTFIIKVTDQDRLIAFNGNKYLIITRSKKLVLVTLCKIRKRRDAETSKWLLSLADKFRQKGY